MSEIHKNDSIIIRCVANGYQVKENSEVLRFDKIHVFESFEGLVGFLEDHFTWRNTAVKEDYDDEILQSATAPNNNSK